MKSRIVSFFLLSSLLALFFVSPALSANPSTIGEKMMSAKLFGGKVVLGTIDQIVEKTITVIQIGNDRTDLITTEITKFRKDGRVVNLTGLKVGDRIVASGGLDTDGSFLVNTLVAKTKVLKQIERRSLYGVVEELSEKSFTVKHPSTGKVYEIQVGSQTLFRLNGKKMSFGSLKKGQRVVAMVIIDQAEATGRLILVLPEKTVNPAKEATPAATP